MINVNSISSHLSKTAASDLSPLVEKLAKKADTNRDGKVSSGEFQEFLSGLMKSIDESQAAESTASAKASGLALPAGTQPPSAAAAVKTIRAIAAAIAKE